MRKGRKDTNSLFESSLISIELPKTFGTRVRNALDASPTSVDFRLLCPYFYLFGVKLLDLVVDEALSKVLKEVSLFFYHQRRRNRN